MKKFFLFYLGFVFLFIFNSFSQNKVILLSQKNNETLLKFQLSDYKFVPVSSDGSQVIVEAENLTSILEAKAPDLPKFTTSLIIPTDKKMSFEVVEAKYEIIENVNIAPSKGNLTRDINPNDVPYEYGKPYQTDDFYPYKLVQLNKPYILRDFRALSVYVYPFQYNPIKKQLKVYTEIIVKIYPSGKGVHNVLKNDYSNLKIPYEFEQIYQHHFLNYSQIVSKYTPLEEEGSMLIIAYDDFVDEMQDFVIWKNTIGRKTVIVPLSSVGNTASDIKNYVANYYQNNDLAYLLLVGDADQIPTNEYSGLGGPSDNAYGYLEGDDHYQEIFVGRFSATDENQVLTMVQRTITYERGTELEDNWLNKPMAIASDQGPGDDDEYDYQHARNMLSDLLNFTYVDPPYELFDGSQGGQDDAGDPTPEDVADVLNQGAGIITYTGHGSELSWVTSAFSVSDVHSLGNVNKLPFVWSVACVVGNFTDYDECFAESWLRATNANGEPIGAIAFFGSTINQSWSPPMEAQDEMVDILVESYQDNIKRTFAGISINGCFKMNDTYQDYDMTDTWTVFGDPSVYVRTDNPAPMMVSYDPAIIYGNTSFQVNCDFDGALATISKNGQIIGSAYVSGGSANIELDQSLYQPGDILTLAVIGFNKETYLAEIPVITPEGPFVSMTSVLADGPDFVYYNNSLNLTLFFKNIGVEPASDVHFTLTTNDPYVSLQNNQNVLIGDFQQDEEKQDNSVSLTVSPNIPDMHEILFHISITDNSGNVWENDFKIYAYAPNLFSERASVLDTGIAFTSTPVIMANPNENYSYLAKVESFIGNGNGYLEAGEKIDIVFKVLNKGHAYINDVYADLYTNNANLIPLDNHKLIPFVNIDEPIYVSFPVFISNDIQIGELATLTLVLNAGAYSDTLIADVTLGIINEDFEADEVPSYFENTGDYPWEIVNDYAYKGQQSISVSPNLDNSQNSQLSVTLNNVPANSTLDFAYKVSSENNYDFLEFYVNGSLIESWSGEIDWDRYTYTFPESGDYTITWVYSKDGSVSDGLDRAWIDDIYFPVVPAQKRGFTISPVLLPDWLTLSDNGDGTALLSGITPNVDSVYKVSIMATDGFYTDTQTFNIQVSPLVLSVDDLNNLTVYPNPTSDYLNLVFPDNRTYSVEIYDLNGKLIYAKFKVSEVLFVNLKSFKSGVYLMKVNDGQNEFIYKIVKQ